MIQSREDINNLLSNYLDTENEYVQSLHTNLVNWDGHRQALYNNGVVLGKVREKDRLTMEILRKGVDDKALKNEIGQALNAESQRDVQKEKDDLRNLSIIEWIYKYCIWAIENIPEIKDSERKVLAYLFFAYQNYQNDKDVRNPYNSDVDEIKRIDPEILDRYDLLPKNENRTLISIDPPRIYDKILDRTFLIKNVPVPLLQEFDKMINKQIAGAFSIRVYNAPGYKGKLRLMNLREEVERGDIFDLDTLNECSVTKLYSTETKYDDCLWVIAEKTDITFEELCEDFDTDDNKIITQMIHLQYKTEDNETYITHLDHEYIFYTFDEYTRRLLDHHQKGTAKRRMKSFKIDQARIPFNYRCEICKKDNNSSKNELFLYFVLDSYFKHKDLLKEYFQKVL